MLGFEGEVGAPSGVRTARFRVELPASAWIREPSRRHPDTVFRMLTGVEAEGAAIETGELRGGDVEAAAASVREHPAVDEYEQLHLDERRALARYRVEDLSLYRFLRQAQIPPERPVEVQDGSFEVEFTAGPESIEHVDAMLDGAGLEHELVFLVGQQETRGLVTDRQRRALLVALKEGYLEVPRQAKLADVAAELDVDPSTASGLLRRGQARVLGWFLSTARPEG